MCSCCVSELESSECKFCWIEQILQSPLSWIVIISLAVLVFCVVALVVRSFIKLSSKCQYRAFLKEHLNLEYQNKEIDTLIEDSKKQLSEKIKPYVSKELSGNYQVNVEKVQQILNEAEKNLKEQIKEKNELHKLYLSRLSDSFGD